MTNVNDLSFLLICDLSWSFVYLYAACFKTNRFPSIWWTLVQFQNIPRDRRPELTVWWGAICRVQGWAPSKSAGPRLWSTQRDPCGNTIQEKGPNISQLICSLSKATETKSNRPARAKLTYDTAGYELLWSEEVSSSCTGDWTLIMAGLSLKTETCYPHTRWSGGQVERGCALMSQWPLDVVKLPNEK